MTANHADTPASPSEQVHRAWAVPCARAAYTSSCTVRSQRYWKERTNLKMNLPWASAEHRRESTQCGGEPLSLCSSLLPRPQFLQEYPRRHERVNDFSRNQQKYPHLSFSLPRQLTQLHWQLKCLRERRRSTSASGIILKKLGELVRI